MNEDGHKCTNSITNTNKMLNDEQHSQTQPIKATPY